MRIARYGALSLLLLLVAYAVLPASASFSQSPFLFMKDLRIGMEGIGKVAIGGDQVRIFQVRIIGIFDNPGELNDYILVRGSGDLIREAGGFAQGMSGSPIYINERLIGGFFAAFAYDDSPNPIGYVRPIETMLKLIEPIRRTVEAQSHQPLIPRGELERGLTRLEDGKLRFEELRAPDTVQALPTGTPLWVSGLTDRALSVLKSGLSPQVLEKYASSFLPLASPGFVDFFEGLQMGFEERFGTTIYPLAATTAQPGGFAEEVEPGRPVAALLSNGDVLFGGLCTTTYIDPETHVLLACGHEFYHTGASGMFLARGRYLDVSASSYLSFVIPEVDRSEIIGTVLEDRTQAIGAALDYTPPAVKLNVHLDDETTGTAQDLTVNLSKTSNFVPSLVFAILLQAVDSTLNRIGPGTMRIEYAIHGTEMPKRLQRSDIFTNFSDIAYYGPLQAAQIVFLLSQNEFLDPGVDRVDVDIAVNESIHLLQVKSIQTDKEVYQPGETVRYTVQLRPYRGEEKTATGVFKLPDDATVKNLTLHVFGGPRRQQNGQGQTIAYDDLGQLIDAVEGSTTNDQLTVELLGLPQGSSEEGDEERAPVQDVQKLGDWVLTGEGRVSIQIQLPEQPKQEEEHKDEESKEPEKKCSQLFYC
ncbi:MAG: hypothetical protein A2Z21_08250 [Candidatus Fraserbacteria bacterium RBG_16_55_9]|uniref:Peptidase S55 domain-containing protein n=1 Tax=Fraserbacteria sp. (strain RBG_16_55_9) TaxID=1817864 RepID=A0A1F5UNN3_FRAXR|nr:MAG: hypothetical protein A2Z21_08250 [Candidatus Fraserbacteria bacterium RBG_16_55_9]